ncbi:hypothetical protein NKH61_05260 [Mesorhizobium sp. M1005]|uniref:hypothetical protein n=1 Tax=unclassified Mesorhizobium TaxID=325217 RepID=UPI003334D64F
MVLRTTDLEVQGILNAGGSVEIDASHYSSLARLGFAQAVKEGATLRIVNSSHMSGMERIGVAKAGGGRVILT